MHHLNKHRQNVSPTKPTSAASGSNSTCEGNSTKSINGEKDDTVEVISGVPATPTGAMLPVTVSPSRKRLLVDGDVSDYQDSCEEHSDDDDLDDSGGKDMPSTSFTIESSVVNTITYNNNFYRNCFHSELFSFLDGEVRLFTGFVFVLQKSE